MTRLGLPIFIVVLVACALAANLLRPANDSTMSGASTEEQFAATTEFHRVVVAFNRKLVAVGMKFQKLATLAGTDRYEQYLAARTFKGDLEELLLRARVDLVIPKVSIKGATELLEDIRDSVLLTCKKQIEVATKQMELADSGDYRPSQIVAMQDLGDQTVGLIALQHNAIIGLYFLFEKDTEAIDFENGGLKSASTPTTGVGGSNEIEVSRVPADPTVRGNGPGSTNAAAKPDDTADNVEPVR